jgi:hypothetical protein
MPPPVEPGSDAPATLTLTHYWQLAAYFSTVIDEVSVIIPGLLGPVVPRGRSATAYLNVPMKFLSTAIHSVEQNVELQVIRKLDTHRGRDTLQLIEAFRPIRDKILAFERNLGYALNSRQSELALEALDTYSAAQSLARDGSNSSLTAAVGNMKRDLGRRGPRKKKPASASEVAVSAVSDPHAPEGEIFS